MKVKRTILIAVICILAVLVIILIVIWIKRPDHTDPSVTRGTVECFHDFPSENVPPRNVYVWLPEGYEAGEPCAVIYMHDAQMLFDASITWNLQEWAVDETAGQLIAEGRIPRCIVVAINNSDNRLNEYFPEKTLQYLGDRQNSLISKTTLGDDYLRFVVQELKPFVEERYHPLTDREHTFMIGSSMGGLISLYALCEYPDVFGGVACLSSHLSMAFLPVGNGSERLAGAFADYVSDNLPEANSSRVYMDHGKKGFDAAYVHYQPSIDSIFRQQGWDDAHYRSLVFEGHDHSENSWAKRLPETLIFLLGGLGWTDEERALIENQPAVMRVLTVENEADLRVLRKPCRGISARELADPMYEALAERLVATVTSPEQDGVGIAGPQVGISRNIIAVQRFDKEGEPFEVYPNIRIVAMRGDPEPGPEGCLSVPGRRGDVLRWRDIDICYTSPETGREVTERIEGFTAVIFQHETDHLKGILYIDKLCESN